MNFLSKKETLMKKNINIQGMCIVMMMCVGVQTMLSSITERTLEGSVTYQFIYAVQTGDVDGLRKLYTEHKHLLNSQGCSGAWTALHYAVHAQQKNIVALLLDLKANVYVKTSHGNTPLHIAAQTGNKEIMELLLEKRRTTKSLITALINTPNNDGNTPLHLATKVGEKGVIELLLSHGAHLYLYSRYDWITGEVIGKEEVVGSLPSCASTTTQSSISRYTKKKRLKPSESKKRVLPKKKAQRDKNSKVIQTKVPMLDLTQLPEASTSRVGYSMDNVEVIDMLSSSSVGKGTYVAQALSK